jgi:hypothetical protein
VKLRVKQGTQDENSLCCSDTVRIQAGPLTQISQAIPKRLGSPLESRASSFETIQSRYAGRIGFRFLTSHLPKVLTKWRRRKSLFAKHLKIGVTGFEPATF